jgi:hypothetical protein
MAFKNLFIVYNYHLPPHKKIILYVFFKVLNIKISPYVVNRKEKKKLNFYHIP